VLNAKNHGREAQIVAQAGRKFAVTVATNMAGRGTDIVLGGNAEMMSRAHFDPDENPEQFDQLFKGLKEQCDAEKQEVLEAGGLMIIGTERHESRRIDNQLRGRAGRQGDPGASRFFLSLEDDLMRIFGADRITGLMERLGMEEDVPIEAPMVNRAIQNAQKKVEAMHFDTRKNLFEYDNVMNEQRKAIYALRKQILEGRYVPEILDDEARREAEAKGSLGEPPKTSGDYTMGSMAGEVRDRTTAIIDRHAHTQHEKAGRELELEGPPYRTPVPFPDEGIDTRELTHDLYRHFGAMVPLVDDVEAVKREYVVQRSVDVVAASLIQQRERVHDLAFDLLSRLVISLCPADQPPDDWDLRGLEQLIKERFYIDVDLSKVVDDVDKLIDMCWDGVESSLVAREEQAGLYRYLFYVRQIYLKEIDERWVAHLKHIEHLRAGIGLVGYATRDPKNEYKIQGYNLFKEMWDEIEYAVLDQCLKMELSDEQKRLAEEGAEHETTLTRASRRREGRTAQVRAGGQLDKLQAAARRAAEQLRTGGSGVELGAAGGGAGAGGGVLPAGGGAGAAPAVPAASPADDAKRAAEAAAAKAKGEGSTVPKVGRNDPCPCGSGKRYKKCHGKSVA
jgi:preprotein translocase subunit SecA